jgi:hypothetical protein|tara:strand:+ start:458 stop:958 length:501 start_codon:yes stop_codon:yes gene_type:complete
MINAWALLYDELYDEEGKMITPDDERDYLKWVKENGGFEYTPEPSTGNVEITADGFTWPVQDVPTSKPRSRFKFNEDVILNEVKDYISGTYRAHYNSGSGIQTLDLINSCGDAEAFCRSNILKYASRYDKKGTAKMDIQKIIHYAVLLYHFSGLDQEKLERGYETF